MAGRILHCIPTMGGGGAERQLAYLAHELGRLGWTVHVALTGRGPNWERLERSGAVIHEIAATNPYDVRLVRQLRGLIADLQPDVVQVWLRQMEIFAGLAAAVGRCPWIFSERASAGVYPPGLKSAIRRQMAGLATAIVSNSVAGDDYWAAQRVRQARRYVIPNAVPIEEIDATAAATAEEFGIDPRQPLILFAGRFAPQKDIDTLLRAIKLLVARRPVQVFCCGEGPLRRYIDQSVARANVNGRVKISGYVPGLWGLMKRAAVFVSPSLCEGSPNVVLEAMAGGVPLVVSDIPEHRELVDERSALLVHPRSSEELALAIEAVLDDRQAGARRAAVALQRVQRFRLDAMAAQYHQVYLDVLSAKDRPGDPTI